MALLPPSTSSTEPLWQVVLRTHMNGVVLWNQELNALRLEALDSLDPRLLADTDDPDGLEIISADEAPTATASSASVCPLCLQKLQPPHRQAGGGRPTPSPTNSFRRLPGRRPNGSVSYFSLLSEANSRTQSPRTTNRSEESIGTETGEPMPESSLNAGYYRRFFVEIEKLGKGGSGTVHLVRHVLNGEGLGLYACKRVAIGDNSTRLPQLLREVHLLEALSHPNLVQYHHVWVEESRLSPYGPPIPTLHLLMAYANGGDLGSFVARRSGGPGDDSPTDGRDERVRRFRMRNLSSVHLLRLDEILSIFEDVCEGLAFLHSRNILHLDIKAENILLHWEEDALLPVAKISDLGSSDTVKECAQRTRMGGSGTLDWTPPEAWERDPKTQRLHPPDRSTDLWSLGLILHLLSFFTLPYHNLTDDVLLEQEIRAYPGFFIPDAQALDHGTRHDLPTSLLRIMTRLINRNPLLRPSCIEVLAMLQHVREQSLSEDDSLPPDATALVKQRTPSPGRAPPLEPEEPIRQQLNIAPIGVRDISSTPVSLAPAKRPIGWGQVLARRRPRRFPVFKSYIALGALLKAISIQRLCRTAPLSPFALYAVLVPTLIDAAFVDPWLSLFLWSVHLFALGWWGRGAVCVGIIANLNDI